jgi:hypothetical protein
MIRAGASATFWKQWGVPRGDEHEAAGRHLEVAAVRLGPDRPFEDEVHLVLALVDVLGRSLHGSDLVLDGGERPIRRLGPGEDPGRPAHRPLQDPSLIATDDERLGGRHGGERRFRAILDATASGNAQGGARMSRNPSYASS